MYVCMMTSSNKKCYWPFVRGIHQSPVNSPHKGQWRGALMFSLIWARTNICANIRDAGDLRRHRAHYDVIIMVQDILNSNLYMLYGQYSPHFSQCESFIPLLNLLDIVMHVIVNCYIMNCIALPFVFQGKCLKITERVQEGKYNCLLIG